MPIQCPYCGVKSDAGRMKCRFCGARLDVQSGNAGWQSPDNAGGQYQAQTPPPCGNYPAAPQEPELYNPTAAGWWCLLVSPVFGAWCVWQNAKTLGDKKMEQTALAYMITALVLIVGSTLVELLINLPRNSNGIIGLVLLFVYYSYVQKPQSAYLRENHIRYRKKPWGAPVMCALGLMILFIAFAVGIEMARG